MAWEDPNLAIKEVERIRKYGLLPPRGDMLGTWLIHAMTGKQEFYQVDRDGVVVKPEDIKPPFKNPYQTKFNSNSVENPLLYCAHEISIHWDQWVECRIVCLHGSYTGVSDFLNFTEALMRAVVHFNEADHPSLIKEDEDEDDEYDYETEGLGGTQNKEVEHDAEQVVT